MDLLKQQIKDDLLSSSPLNPGEVYPPFQHTDTPHQKIQVALRSLRRNIKEKQRKAALLNAFFIGQVLYEAGTSTEEFKLKKALTRHYQAMAENTFLLFELNPQQILRTAKLQVQDIRKMKKPFIYQVLEEVRSEIFLVGTRNLVEEDCYGDDLLQLDLDQPLT